MKKNLLTLASLAIFTLSMNAFAKSTAAKRSPSDICDTNLSVLGQPKCGSEALQFASDKMSESGRSCEGLATSKPKEGSKVKIFSMQFGKRSKDQVAYQVITEETDSGCIVQEISN